MAHARKPQPDQASRDALRWEQQREKSRTAWERDKQAADYAWRDTLRRRWPQPTPTPVTRPSV